jgi:hypothetical protein
VSFQPFRHRGPRAARSSAATTVASIAAVLLVSIVLAACSSGADSTPSAGASSPSAAASGGGGSGGDAGALLGKTLPTQVGDIPMTVTSGSLPDVKDEVPNYDQLVQQLNNAGIQPDGVLGAVSVPTDGSKDPRASALEIVEAPPGGLGLLGLMQAWISGIPGATTQNTNVGGKPVVQVTFADGSLPMYYYLFDTNRSDADNADTIYYVRTADETLAADALSQLP